MGFLFSLTNFALLSFCSCKCIPDICSSSRRNCSFLYERARLGTEEPGNCCDTIQCPEGALSYCENSLNFHFSHFSPPPQTPNPRWSEANTPTSNRWPNRQPCQPPKPPAELRRVRARKAAAMAAKRSASTASAGSPAGPTARPVTVSRACGCAVACSTVPSPSTAPTRRRRLPHCPTTSAVRRAKVKF